MKKLNFVSIFALLMLLAFSSSIWAAEAPYIYPIDNQTATLGEVFTYDVDAVNADPAETYQLLSSRPGMTIDPSTGVITWTPSETSDGGTVSVRAYNSAGESVRTFVVFISDAVECNADLISYFKLDETSGDVFEDYKGIYDATTLTPLPAIDAKVDKGQLFEPLGKTDQFIYVTDQGQYDFLRTDGFSTSLWFRYDGEHLTDDTNNQVLVARGTANDADEMTYLIMLDVTSGSPKVSFGLRPRNQNDPAKYLTSSQSINEGVWYHVVAVYEGAALNAPSTLRLYVNTAMDMNTQIFSTANFNGDSQFDLNIGWWDAYENRYSFNGAIDEVLIYDKALDYSEVSGIYNDGLGGQPHCKPGNYYPLFSSVPVTAAAQDVEYSYTVEASDYNNDPITLSGVTIPSWLTFTPGNGLLTGTPDNTEVGDHDVVIKATVGTTEILQEFTISVTNTNDPPVFTSTPVTTGAENVAYTAFITATDPDNDVLVYTAPVLPSWLTFDGTTHALIGIPTRSDAGENPVTIMVSDGVFQITQEFVITVTSSNNKPVITSVPLNLVDNYTAYEYTITAFDADVADVLTFSPETLPSWATFDPSTHILSGTPQKIHVGDHPVVLVVSDGWEEVKQEFTITVRDVNTPPVITSEPNDTAKVGELYAYRVGVSDYDGDLITCTGLIIPTWMTFDANSKVLSGTPAEGDVGPHNVFITVSDGMLTINHNFVINVVSTTAIDFSKTMVSKVYPNPAQDHVTFEFAEQVSDIQITDMSGRVLIQESVQTGDMNVHINLSELDGGMYMYRVFDALYSQHQTGKFVIN